MMFKKYLVFVSASVDVLLSSFVTGKLQGPTPEMLKKFSMLVFFLLAETLKGKTEEKRE